MALHLNDGQLGGCMLSNFYRLTATESWVILSSKGRVQLPGDEEVFVT